MRILARTLTALFASLVLASCGTTYTMPTAAEMDNYYKKAEELAQKRIQNLEAQKQRGEITHEEFELQKEKTLEKIPEQASQLAWARHESIEAQKRALGIPTGDHPVQVQVPTGGSSGETFYRRAGTSGADYYTNTPTGGTIFGGPNRGQRGAPPRQEEPEQPKPAPQPEEEVAQ